MNLKFWVRWILINGMFMLFFLLEHALPVWLFSGGFFVVWFFTILGILAVSMFMFALILSPDFLADKNKAKLLIPTKPRWYYIIDIVYDVTLLFVLASVGHQIYAVFYGALVVLMLVTRSLIQSTFEDL
jgi:hypothetical protein